jgi:O-antigen ligase
MAGLVLAFSPGLQIQFTLPKLVILRALVPLLIVVWMFRSRNGETRRVPAVVLIATVALGVWWVITTLFAVDRPTALNGAHGRFNGLWTQSLLLTLFLLSATSSLPPKDLLLRLKLLLAALVPAALYAIAQHAGWDVLEWPANNRPASTLGNPVVLAATLGLGVPFALALALIDSRRLVRWMFGLTAAILVSAIVVTLSRGPLIGMAVSLVIMTAATLQFGRMSRRTASVAIVIALLTLLVSGAYVVRSRSGRVFPTLADLMREGQIQDRVHTLSAALRMVRDHPIFGVGLENFTVLYPRYRPPEAELITPDVVPTMVHSGYLQAAVTTGVPGLCLYLFFLLVVMIRLIRAHAANTDRHERLLLAAFIASILGYMVTDLTGWPEVPLSALIWILLGLGLAATSGSPEQERQPATSGLLLGLATVWTVVTTILAFQALTLLRTDQVFHEARLFAGHGNWAQVQTRVQNGLELADWLAPYQDAAGLLYAQQFGLSGDRSTFERAVHLFDDAHRAAPFIEYYSIHRIDLETAALQKQQASPARADANAAVSELRAVEHHNGTIYEAIARMRLAEGSSAEALTMIRQAQLLRPQQASYWTLEGDIRRAMGDRPSATVAYRRALAALGIGTPDWLGVKRRLMVTLIEMGDYGAAIEEAKQALAQNPNDSLIHKLLDIANQASPSPVRGGH